MTLSDGQRAMALALTSSLFRGPPDAFTPTFIPFHPLPFDLVADGCPIISTCPIFRLPVELHLKVLRHLDRNDLANIALVDSDCRQLARSMQFASLHLSVNRASLQLLKQILCETVVDKKNGRRVRKIGVCVRRLIVGSGQHHVQGVAGEGTEERVRLVAEMHDVLLSVLRACLPTSFPNLELFHFADSASIQPDLLRSLAKVRLHHVAFDSFGIKGARRFYGETSQHLRDVLDMSAWSDMRTFSAILADGITHSDFVEEAETELVLTVALCTIAPSVEGLKLVISNRIDHALVDSLPEFPRLRRLHLHASDVHLRKILPLGSAAHNNLQSLQLNRIDYGHLAQLGHLPCLTRLVVNDLSLKGRASNFSFLMANPQLELLSFTFPIDSRTLRDTLLPVIHSYGFTSLRILRLASASAHLSKRVIAAIGLIQSLEMLWLSAGEQIGWRYNWFIDHSALKTGLNGLRKLRELAFTRDSYHCELYRNDEADYVRFNYYCCPILPPNVRESSILTLEDEVYLSTLSEEELWKRQVYVWEKWHRNSMLALANEYADLFPDLEFIFLGEYPMEIAPGDGKDSRSRSIRMLSNHRETFLTQLNCKWGSQTV